MANVKITELPAASAAAAEDLIATVDDPGGTPVTRKATVLQVVQVGRPIKYQTATTGGGTSSGSTELLLATVSIPAQPIDMVLEARAFWNGTMPAASSVWQPRIRRTTPDAASVAVGQTNADPSTTSRYLFSLSTSTLYTLTAGVAATYTLVVARAAGSGDISSAEEAGMLTVELTPA